MKVLVFVNQLGFGLGVGTHRTCAMALLLLGFLFIKCMNRIEILIQIIKIMIFLQIKEK
jgi:hypothetical protein